jgi:hypothetical protein
MWMETDMKNRRVMIAVAVATRWLVGAAVVLAGAAGAFGQASDTGMPRVENARVEHRALTIPIAAGVKRWADQAEQAQWIGYSVPEVASDHEVCCNYQGNWGNNGDCGVCQLEGGDHGFNMRSRGDSGSGTSGAGGGTVKLEGPRSLVILLRAE